MGQDLNFSLMRFQVHPIWQEGLLARLNQAVSQSLPPCQLPSDLNRELHTEFPPGQTQLSSSDCVKGRRPSSINLAFACPLAKSCSCSMGVTWVMGSCSPGSWKKGRPLREKPRGKRDPGEKRESPCKERPRALNGWAAWCPGNKDRIHKEQSRGEALPLIRRDIGARGENLGVWGRGQGCAVE